MDRYAVATYGDRVAETYDDLCEGMDPAAAAALLAELAGSGAALELGIGTGRLALPLVELGVEVHGIDASEAMVQRLREKPGGEVLDVTIGDFAEVAVEGSYQLVFVAFNTFFALLTQEAQLRCFANVAGRLDAAGRFVIEAFVPEPARFDQHQRTSTSKVALDQLVIEAADHDPVTQQVTSQTVLLSPRGVRLYPVRLRYAWPAELDLMARLAGMRLRERWGGWSREPFTRDSRSHVSVYEIAR